MVPKKKKKSSMALLQYNLSGSTTAFQHMNSVVWRLQIFVPFFVPYACSSSHDYLSVLHYLWHLLIFYVIDLYLIILGKIVSSINGCPSVRSCLILS
jgi:hypothetical protein